MKDYKKILRGVVNIINTTEKSDIGFTNICTYISESCPELKESEDGEIRKWIINEIKAKHHNLDEDDVDFVDKAIAWLEKQSEQKETFCDVDLSSCSEEYRKAYYDGYNKCNRDWLRKQDKKVQGKSALEAIKEEKVDNANKVEPKFKPGDWVIRKNGDTFSNGSIYE